MIFNSLVFVIFLVVVFTLHWMPLSRNRRHQNIVLMLSSYVFYGWWDPRFLALIIFSSLVDYTMALLISRTENEKLRYTWLMTSISANVGVLLFFKYFNFFINSFQQMMGLPEVPSTLDIILPVGISFYTFQTMSYTIDVYRRQMGPTRDLLDFLTYVNFFPQLVAGPIERGQTLLPQISSKRSFNYDQAVAGCRQILMGAFKKIVVADRLAPMVDTIFGTQDQFGGWMNMLGLVLFSMQLYGDFSGYSDIAIGTAKLFGIDLMRNFNRPYFSRDVGEFWRRWHISLSTWFRDYLYIPVGGSRGGKWMIARNVMIIFLVSGLWHGANWTFVIWGGLNGLLFLPLILSGTHKRRDVPFSSGDPWLTMKEIGQVVLTFILVCLTRAFFRAENVGHAMTYLRNMVAPGTAGGDFLTIVRKADLSIPAVALTLAFTVLLVVIDLLSMKPRIEHAFMTRPMFRYAGYAGLILIIGLFGVFTNPQAFIYFQF
jgi:alginate O-acetyltransferase complex protein AlgI